ncbi:hypothetical protein GIW69_11610 [Pseudomonas syringae]|nr:hypothetical protein [Pseudomonas syringae]
MRPKPPVTQNPPRITQPTAITPPHGRPDGEAPLVRPPQPSHATLRPGATPDINLHGSADQPAAGTSTRSGVAITDLPDFVTNQSGLTPPLNRYLLKPAMLRGLQPADDEGFRYIVGRKFVDVKDVGTVYVEYDASVEAYRAMDLYKKLPSGPALYKISGEATWSAEKPGTKRPHPDGVGISDPQAKRSKAIDLNKLRTELNNDLLPRLFPAETSDQIAQRLRDFNLSPEQHERLRQDLLKELRIPQWAEQHKILSLDADATDRFDHLHAEIEPLILHLRNGTATNRGLTDFEDSVSRAFLDAFLVKLGYRRNKNDCLYRTDIPGLFRADERTPFELDDSGRMLPRMKHPPGATSEKPISATISLDSVKTYASGTPDPQYLTYNSQRNKYPGKSPDDSDDGSSSDSSESSESEWSDSAVSLDSERNYETTRHNQKVIFTYAIDTRGMEVVLAEENIFFNLGAQRRGAWFPEDDLEALISASRSGITTDRIWLLDSSLTRGAKIDDVVAQAETGFLRNSIEDRTHAGSRNQHEYDALIDAAADAGKPILDLPAGRPWFANDIVWPE